MGVENFSHYAAGKARSNLPVHLNFHDIFLFLLRLDERGTFGIRHFTAHEIRTPHSRSRYAPACFIGRCVQFHGLILVPELEATDSAQLAPVLIMLRWPRFASAVVVAR